MLANLQVFESNHIVYLFGELVLSSLTLGWRTLILILLISLLFVSLSLFLRLGLLGFSLNEIYNRYF